jgi:hypothetical protein
MNSIILSNMLINSVELEEFNTKSEMLLAGEIIANLLDVINTSAGLEGEEAIRLAVYEQGNCTLIDPKTLNPYK